MRVVDVAAAHGAIVAVLRVYVVAVYARYWHLFDDIFAPNAQLDYFNQQLTGLLHFVTTFPRRTVSCGRVHVPPLLPSAAVQRDVILPLPSAVTGNLPVRSLVAGLYPEKEVRERPLAPEPKAHDDPGFQEIPRPDYSDLPRQQVGLHAIGFNEMRLSSEVEGMYRRLIHGYLAGLDQTTLT